MSLIGSQMVQRKTCVVMYILYTCIYISMHMHMEGYERIKQIWHSVNIWTWATENLGEECTRFHSIYHFYNFS